MKKQSLKERISNELLIPMYLLDRVIQRAPYSYKIYSIPKKNKGRRIIAQPAKETKYIQHWLIDNIFNLLPIHEAATAYKKGASIKKNILVHVNNEFICKFDFKTFFTSIKEDHLRRHLFRHLGEQLEEEEIQDIIRVVCIRQRNDLPLCLSIGAPSSPILSNSIMYEFDLKVTSWCQDNGFVYTRYADDLTFSTNKKEISNKVEPAIRKIIRKLEYPILRFNNKKTIHLSKKYQRVVTGLTITNEGKVSIGRSRKREISALIHKYTLQSLVDKEIFRLQGLIAFAKDAEPLFISRMRSKYGQKVIEELLKKRKLPI
ncbi:MAG: retron St85 family RNA-directed DNA polymerase [Methylococcales bacterium]